MNKLFVMIFVMVLSAGLMGCETVHKAGEATGTVIGETTNEVGSVTTGGAKAVQGKTTAEENPYNR